MKLFDGNYQSRGFAIERPRESIERALPRQLVLADRHGDLVPVFFLAGQQAINPSGFPLAEVYSEAIIAVPGVALRDGPQRSEFVWMPLLYVDHLLPIVVNLVYGFPKRFARFTWRDNALEIHEPFVAQPRVRMRWSDSEQGVALAAHLRLANGAWQQPAINFVAGIPLIARMQFVPGEILVPSDVEARFNIPTLPFLPAQASVAAIERATLGGFRTVQEYSFGPPERVQKSPAGPGGTEPSDASGPKRKIAILGGGVGAITTAFALTSQPDWQRRFDITVYQRGWRLGGKGASGRNPDANERIEEHGLHVWAGFYENAFRCLRECYGALESAGIGGVFPSWRDAFEQQSTVTQHEFMGGKWQPITTHWPTNDAEPGSGRDALDPADYLHMLLSFLTQSFQRPNRAIRADTLALARHDDPAHPATAWIAEIGDAEWPEPRMSGIGDTVLHDATDTALHLAERLLRLAGTVSAGAPHTAHPELMNWLKELLAHFQQKLDAMFERDLKDDELLYAWYLLMNVGVASARGIVEENVLERGFDHLDELDLREFLERYGASPLVLQSSVLRGGYDYVFGYPQGDVKNPRLAAGVGLRGGLRVFLTYKGAMMWKMRAGMGDTIFAPYYKLLKSRGVHFEFFNSVTNLGVTGDRIVTIDMDRQAVLKNPVRGYEPLRRVGDLDCWPDRPDWDQLAQGEVLKESGIDFESFWDEHPAAQKIQLRLGEHFDDVVLGIAPGAFPYIAKELDAQPRWKNMTAHLHTVQTLAMQLWLSPSLSELGWHYGTTISTSYVENWSTWADMSHLLPAERWEKPNAPKNLAYFCGTLADAPSFPPGPDRTFAAQQLNRVKCDAAAWLDANIAYLWPRAATPAGRFNRGLVCSEYYRANIDPSERYVLSLPGTMQYRLRADDTPFVNLYLAGDWTRTSINAGCVEAATMSGLRAAAGISRQAVRIDDDEEL